MSYFRTGDQRRFGRGTVKARRGQRLGLRPNLLALEERTLLSTFAVYNTTDDRNPGSLRWAIGQANSNPGADTITFDSTVFATPKTIYLSGSQLELTDTTGAATIIGPAAGVSVNGNQLSRVFQINRNVTASISGLTIAGGQGVSEGGGLYNQGTLTLTDATVSGNSGSDGGGLYNRGIATLIDTTVSGNTASNDGGGIFNLGTLTLTGSSISGNSAKDGGGLINRGTATLSDSTVSVNSALNGAGTYNQGGSLALTNCTVSSNFYLDPGVAGVPSLSSAGSSDGFTIPTSGLLQTSLSSTNVVGNVFNLSGGEGLHPGGIAMLKDGQFGPPGLTDDPGPNPDLVILINGEQITYNLDTGTNPLGYDITNINTYAGWRDSGHSRQDYTVLYSTVLDPTRFQVLSDVSTPTFDGSPSDTAAFLTSSTGILASHVAAIRFSFPLPQNAYVGYRELFVQGTPSTGVVPSRGSGLFNSSGNATLVNCTFSGNSGATGAGLYSPGGTTTLTNSIVAGNTSDISGNVTGSHNLIGTGGSGGLINGTNGNIVGVANPGLGVLGSYGGPTLTMPLLPGSPAIGKGTASGVTADQRGFALDAPIDIGAFQRQSSLLVVNTTVDGPAAAGRLSLRQAVNLANLLEGDQSITFDPVVFATSQRITLGGTLLELSDTTGTTTITGPAGGVTVNADGKSRVFQIDPNVKASISGLSITGGNAGYGGASAGYNGWSPQNYSGNYDGGGLLNQGTLALTNCTVSGNSALSGGGLFNSGTVTLTNCTFVGSNARESSLGGGVFNSGTATLTNTIVAGNFVFGYGLSDPTDIGGSVNGTFNLIGDGNTAGGLTDGVDGNLVGRSLSSIFPTDASGNPVLGTYGATGQTVALLPGSPAIDAGTSGAGVLTTDERGKRRFGAVDIGAFESQGFILKAVAGSSPQSADIGKSFANALGLTLTANDPVEPVDGAAVDFVVNPVDGARAYLSSSSAVISGGLASVTAAPNNALGSYTVVASLTGSPPVSFALTNTGTPFTKLVVNTTQDALTPTSGLMSLRKAISLLDLDSTGISGITFDPAVFSTHQTITLSGAELELSNTTETMTITGPAAGLTISGGGLSRVFHVDSNVTASISGLTISGGNTSVSGGGVYNQGTLTLTDCTVSGNTASGVGGGVWNSGGSRATLTNCTVVGNTAGRYGGAIADSGQATLTNCTVSGNTAGRGGGGLSTSFSPTSSTGMTLTNTIVAGNITTNTRPNAESDVRGYPLSGGYNIIGIATVGYKTGWTTTDLTGSKAAPLNPMLVPLGDYGGPNQTLALLPGSPAIDAGTSVAGVLATDERGVSRVGGVDIGAFESEGFTLTVSAGSQQNANIGSAFAKPLTVTVAANNPLEPVNGGVISFGGKPFNGPTAVPSVPSTVIAGGRATITAAPNNALGSYDFVASAGGLSTTSFALTNTGTRFAALVVNTTSDSLAPGAGLLSLREAVGFANYDSLGMSNITFDPIVFASAQTITLTGTPLELLNTTEAVTITGPAAGVTVSGGGLIRVFQVEKGATASLSGLTISGGTTSGNGGGLYVIGTATLTNCTVSGNSASSGGGLFNVGTVILTGSTVSGNSGKGDRAGGGLYNLGTATLTDCTISGNAADGAGFNNRNTRYVNDNGGGLYNVGSAALTNCTVSGNSAKGLGGGLANYPLATLTLTNSTISGNSAKYGGGFFNQGAGTLTLTNSTVSGNTGLSSGGGGISNGTTKLTNTIVAGNVRPGSQFTSDLSGRIVSAGYNLIGVANGGSGFVGSDLRGSSSVPLKAMLAPLGYYGGLTQTMPLLPGSPALDAGAGGASVPATDQRGSIRSGVVDIGAFESSGFALAIASGSGQTASGVFSAALVVTVTASNPSEPVAGGLVTFTAPTEGPSATLTGSPAVIGGDGNASVVAASNFVGGSYIVSATFRGTADSADFSLTNFALMSIALSPGKPLLALGVAAQLTATGTFSDGSTQDITKSAEWASGTPSVAAFSGFTVTGLDLGTSTITASMAGITSPEVTLTVIAPSFVVNTTADTSSVYSGTTSLREAIQSANLVPGQTITFDPAVFTGGQTISLTLGQIELSNQAGTETITGPAGGVTVSGGGRSRVFQVDEGVTALFSGLTISGGSTTGNGGGLYNRGTATLTDCTISGNSASGSGGVSNSGGTITLTNCTISGNTAGFVGGMGNYFGTAVLIDCTISGNRSTSEVGGFGNFRGTSTLTDSTVSGNTAAGNAGGILKQYGTLTMTGCTISGNSSGDKGGGLYVFDEQFGYDDADVTTLNSCTISGNTAKNKGGGVYSYRAGLEFFTDCTIVGNSTLDGGGIYNFSRMTLTNTTVKGNSAINDGGGIFNRRLIRLTTCTISENTAGINGGGMYNDSRSFLTNSFVTGNSAATGGGLFDNRGSQTLNNSVVAGNTAVGGGGFDPGTAPDVQDKFITSLGRNLIGVADGSAGWFPSDFIGTSTHPVVYWTGNAGNNDWDTASNWVGNAVPGQNPLVIPKVVIPNGVTVTHAGNTTETIDSLSVGSGATVDTSAGKFAFDAMSGQETATFLTTLIMTGTGSVIVNGGSLTGSGLIRGNVTSSARVNPTGSIVIGGSFTQTVTGTIDISLAGTVGGIDYGQLYVNGAASLNGTLNVALAAGFAPGDDNAFVPLSFGSIAGDFGSKSLPAGLSFLYNANTLILLPPAPAATTSGDATQRTIPQATVTVPSNAARLNLESLPVGATVTINSNPDESAVTGPNQNFTAIIPLSARFANLVVNGGAASNTNIVNGFLGALTLNPAGTDNTFIALNTKPVSVPTATGGKITSDTFVVNLNTPNVVQTPLSFPGSTDPKSLLDPSLLVTGSLATLVLGGRFQKAVVGSGVTLYAAPAVVSGGTAVPGTHVLIVGSGNKVFGAAGAVVQAYSGGNTVIQSSDSAITAIVNAYAATTGPQAQSYLNSVPIAQQAFLQANAAGIAKFLAGDALSLAAFLRGNPASISQYLVLNSAAAQAFLAGNSAAVAQYLATNTAAASAYLTANSAAVTAFIAGEPDAQQSFLRQNGAAVASYIASNSTALAAFLNADSGGISAYIASNSTALAAFLQANPNAPNGGAELQAYLRQNPTLLSSFLTSNPATLQTYLAGNSTSLQSYLTANPSALSAYLQANARAVSQYIASNTAARQAFLQQGSAGVSAYLASTPAARQAFLSADPAGLSAYLVSASPQSTIDAFLATNPAARSAYLNGGIASLQAFLMGDGNALAAFVDAAPGGLGAYLASSPSALQSYLVANSSALQSYITQNAASIAAYIVGDPINALTYLAADSDGVSSYIVSNPTATSAYLRANPSASQAYLEGGSTGLFAFLQVNATSLQLFIASNPSILQQYLVSAPTGLQQYLAANPTGLSGYLASYSTALQQYLTSNPATLQTYLVTNAAALQTYVTSNPSALQQYLSTNATIIEQYIAANPTALQTYLTANSAALQTYLASNPAALQRYLSSSPAVLQQYLSNSPAALQGYLRQNSAAVVQYLSGNASAQAAFLRQNSAAIAAWLAGNPTAISAFLAADSAGISAYIAANSAMASVFIAGNDAAQAAYGSGDAAGQAALQSYLQANPALLSRYLGINPATLQTYLASSPAALQSYFASNPAGLAAYLAQAPAVIAQYIANNSTALQAYLASNPTGIAVYLASGPAAVQSFLRQNGASVASYIASNSTALAAFLNTDSGGIGAYIATNSTALAAFLQANPNAPNGGAALQAYLRQNPTLLSSFLTGNPNVLGAYLASSPASLAQYLQANASALQSYLSQNATAIAQYIVSNPVGLQAYLAADAAGFSAYLTSNSTLLSAYLASSAFTGDPAAVAANGAGTLAAYLATNPSSMQVYVASNPAILQQYLLSNPASLQTYLTGNSGIVAVYLASSPASQQAYLAANVAGMSAYLTSNSSLLNAFLSWDTTSGNGKANAAWQSGGSVGLLAYLTADPSDLQAYIAWQGTSNNLLQLYLASSPTALAQYLSSASTALAQYIRANPAALSSFLTDNPAILIQYVMANPARLQQYLTANPAALQTYLTANPSVLQQFLAIDSTLLQQYLAGNPAALSQYLVSNAAALQTYLEENPSALLDYLQSSPTSLSQYLTANPAVLQMFLLNNPALLSQFLAAEPSLLQQFLQTNPAILEQFLHTEGATGAARILTGSLLSNFRLNVTLPGSGNQATGGPLSTFDIGTDSLFIESIDSSQLAMVTNGIASGLAASAFRVNVTAHGSNNTLIGGLLANFTVTGSDGGNTFVIEDSGLLGLPAGTAIPASLTGTFSGNGPDDTFFFVGGSSGIEFGSIVLNVPTGVTGDTLDFSNFQGGGIKLDLAATGSQVVSTNANLQLSLPSSGTFTNVIGTPAGDSITGGGSSTRIRHGTSDNPNPYALEAAPPATANVQYVALNFTRFAPTVVSSSQIFHNGNGYYTAAEQQAVLAGISKIYSQFGSLVKFTLDPAEITQLQGMSQAQLALINLTPEDVTTLAGLVDPAFQSSVYDNGAGSYETIYFNNTAVFNTGLGSNGVSAGATTVLSQGAVTGFNISGGSGYTSAPPVSLVSGAGAAASAIVSGGAITGIAITSSGAGYTSAPTVSISGGGGSGATATAVVTGGQVTAINITSAGTGYTSAPTITLNTGSGATATAVLGVSSAVIANSGSGYTSAPTVTISGGGGSGAVGTAVISGGRVIAINFTNPGTGYTSLPTITLTGGGYTSIAAAKPVLTVTGLIVTSPGSGYTSGPTVIFGTPSAGGFSNEVDFGNLNQTTTMLLDANGFLGSASGLVPDSSDHSFNGLSNFVNVSITIAAHELGHTLGLEHSGSLGPIGFGIANPPGAIGYYPAYAGKTGAFTTQGDLMASPASVGSSLANAASGLAQLGARDAIALAFIRGGTTVASNTTDPSNPNWTGMPAPTVAAAPEVTSPVALTGVGTVTAQPVNLYTLDVPNPITTGFDANKSFDVSAVNINGYLGGSAAVLDGNGNPIINPATGKAYTATRANYYTFSGAAGQVMSFQVKSASISSIKNPVDTTLRIFGPNGEVIAFNDDQFEPSDSSIFDLTLPSTGTYTVEVDSFHTSDPSFLDRDSKNYNPAAYYHALHGSFELFMYTFSAFNSLEPAGETNSTTATIHLPVTPPGSTKTVYLNSALAGTVASGATWFTVRNLNEGANSITVNDETGSRLSSYQVIVDTLAPSVSIDTSPPAQTIETTARFTFGGSDSVTNSSQLIYLASLDGGRFGTVTNPAVFANLSVGTHTLLVKAQDLAGNVSQPVSFTWRVMPTVSTTTVVTSTALDGTSIYGQQVILKASVGQITLSPDSPQGEVVFYDGTTRIGSAVLTNGQIVVSVPVSLHAGTHTITATYTGDGTNLTSTSTTYALIVNPAPLTITAGDLSKVYGQPIPAFLASYQGFAPGEDAIVLSGSLQFVTTATAGSSVGTYPVAVSGLSSTDYEIKFVDGVVRVTPATLTVSANDATKLFGVPVPSLSAVYSGFVNGDTAASLTTPARLNTLATASSPVGSYAITPSGATASNYTIRFVPGALEVKPNDGPVTFVTSLYKLSLGRRPEPEGLSTWITRLSNGESQASVVRQIYYSREAKLARARHKVVPINPLSVYFIAKRAEAKATARQRTD
ncbi:DUF4214 domain-containing protein [bacterium]|nr:DUF4214 domain-containing protein [bacterium]